MLKYSQIQEEFLIDYETDEELLELLVIYERSQKEESRRENFNENQTTSKTEIQSQSKFTVSDTKKIVLNSTSLKEIVERGEDLTQQKRGKAISILTPLSEKSIQKK